jgi:hypothetical protein
MNFERGLNFLESFIEVGINGFTESFYFNYPESVGTIRVLEAFPDRKFYPGFDMVYLDFGSLKETDDSHAVFRVPSGLVKTDQIVELFVKRGKAKMKESDFLVSMRPFNPALYSKPFGWAESNLSQIFGYNHKTFRGSRNFARRFLK